MGLIIRLMAMVGLGSTRTVDTLTATGAVPASFAPTPISDQGRFRPDHHLHRLLLQACRLDSGAGNGRSCVKQPGKGGK
jgi:hypothetical protein